jgi:hypothetical protein
MKFWQHIDGDMKDILQRVERAGLPKNPPNFRV